MSPRRLPPLPEPIPGWWVTAALAEVGWAQTDLAEELQQGDSTIVNKWCRAGSGAKGTPQGIKVVTWYGILHALDLPKTWRPKEAR